MTAQAVITSKHLVRLLSMSYEYFTTIPQQYTDPLEPQEESQNFSFIIKLKIQYIHSVEILQFSCHCDFTWNQFWLISDSDKTAILSILEALNHEFLEIPHLKMSKIAQ